MRGLGALIIISFCVTLAVVIGVRMKMESMAVVVGVVCGVLASIPMSVIILLTMGRRMQPTEPSQLPSRSDYPPVVVIQSEPQARQMPSYGAYPAIEPPLTREKQRLFRIIGEEENLLDDEQERTVWW